MKTLKELSRMIAWLFVAVAIFLASMEFYDSVMDLRLERTGVHREIKEAQAQIKAQDAKIDSLKQSAPIEILKRQNKCEQDIRILFTITCLLYLLIAFGGVVIYRLTKSTK